MYDVDIYRLYDATALQWIVLGLITVIMRLRGKLYTNLR